MSHMPLEKCFTSFSLSRAALLRHFESMEENGLQFLIFYEEIEDSISFGVNKDYSHTHTYANKFEPDGKVKPKLLCSFPCLPASVCIWICDPEFILLQKPEGGYFQVPSALGPERPLRQRNTKDFLEQKEKMQSTKHIELSFLLITPQWRKENTNEFSNKWSCHTVFVKCHAFCSSLPRKCLLVNNSPREIHYPLFFCFVVFNKVRMLWFLFWNVGFQLSGYFLLHESQCEMC